jgi:uncharacterized membrane protein YhaH (DUF805 family)
MDGKNPDIRLVDEAGRNSSRQRSNLWLWWLVLGGAIIVASAIYTLMNLQDQTVYVVLIPGVVVGLILVGLSVTSRRKEERSENNDEAEPPMAR